MLIALYIIMNKLLSANASDCWNCDRERSGHLILDLIKQVKQVTSERSCRRLSWLCFHYRAAAKSEFGERELSGVAGAVPLRHASIGRNRMSAVAKAGARHPSGTTRTDGSHFLFFVTPAKASRKRGYRVAEEVVAVLDTRFRGHDGKRAGTKCQTRTTSGSQ
jgi:hypothetical protein